MHYAKKRKNTLPPLTDPAIKLLAACCLVILVYLASVAVYAWHTQGDLYARIYVWEMLHSAAISAVLAIGGGLLLDCELRAREKSGR